MKHTRFNQTLIDHPYLLKPGKSWDHLFLWDTLMPRAGTAVANVLILVIAPTIDNRLFSVLQLHLLQ